MKPQSQKQITGGAEGDRTPSLRKAPAALSDDLEPQRQIQFKLWLVDNPKTSEEYFNEKIWPHFRANILKQRAEPVGVKTKIKRGK